MTITPEEVAKLNLKAMQGDIVPILYIVSDMADLIARQDEVIKAAEALGFYATLIGEKHECPWHMLSDDFGEKARAALAELGDRDMCKNFTELREGEG